MNARSSIPSSSTRRGVRRFHGVRKYFALLFVLSIPVALAAHDPAPPSGETRDFVSNRHGGLSLTAKLVPGAILSASPDDAGANDSEQSRNAIRDRALEYARRHAQEEGLGATVGDVAHLVLRLERGGRPVSGTRFELSFDHIEDDKLVFQTTSGTTNGTWIWGQQFFDGAEHMVQIRATAPNAEPLETHMRVAVEGVSPPADSIVRSMLILLAVVAAGMFVGYWFGVRAGAGRNL